jgi:starch phosphorylase
MIPAADISEQISLAGTEASGTGNMKLMLNGAVTLGTEDGANVEIHEAVGDDNIIIFGMLAHEVDQLRARGYDPKAYYNNNQTIKEILDFMQRGFCGGDFSAVTGSLLGSDYYMALGDFADYCAAQEKASALYGDREAWSRMSLVNTAKAGRFAIDRLIEDYSRDIWNLKKVEY